MDPKDKSALERIAAGSTTVDDYTEAAVDAFYSGGEGEEWRELLNRALALPLTPAERGDVLFYKALYTFQIDGGSPEALRLSEESAALLDGRRDYKVQWAHSAGLIAHLIAMTDPARAARLRSDVLNFIDEYLQGGQDDEGWAHGLCRVAARCSRDAGDREGAVRWIRRGLPEEVGVEYVDLIVELAADLIELQRLDEAESLLVEMEARLVCGDSAPPQARKWEHEVQIWWASVVSCRGEYEKAREMYVRLCAELLIPGSLRIAGAAIPRRSRNPRTGHRWQSRRGSPLRGAARLTEGSPPSSTVGLPRRAAQRSSTGG